MNDFQQLKTLTTTWRVHGIHEVDGVLVACDSKQEDWIKWWHHHYSKHNAFPVAIVNLGMSKKMLNWCSERGEVIQLDIPRELLEKRNASTEPLLGIKMEDSRKTYYDLFHKPFALLNSPFRRTIWIDSDCLIRGSIAELYDYPKTPHFIAMAIDKSEESGEKHYNAGVISYQHGTPIIQKWAKEVIEREGYFTGDQELFSRMIVDQGIEIPILPKKFNWIVTSYGINRSATILNFSGDAKPLGEVLVKDYHRLIMI
jgi:hypothetical protein